MRKPAGKTGHFTISEAARMLDVSPSTLRVWERQGLTRPVRSDAGYRWFSLQEIQRLKRIKLARDAKRTIAAVPAGYLKARPVAVATGLDSQAISRRLRALRLSKTLTLEAVAQKTGLSKGFLSALERCQSTASIATLQKLARMYDTNVLSFFGGGEVTDKLVRPKDRRRVSAQPGVSMELLAGGKTVMEPHLFRIAPQAGSGGSYAHEGEEFLFLIEGQFEIWLDEVERYTLHPGDSLYFSSTLSHRWSNPGRTEAVLLWINTPPTF